MTNINKAGGLTNSTSLQGPDSLSQMALYTVMDADTVLKGLGEETSSYLEMEKDGVQLLVENSCGVQRVVRILSTDPSHYLNEKYYPGQIV